MTILVHTKEERIEMTDFIVCPNCGKKINIRIINVVSTPFLKYITCSDCGKFLTKPQRSTSVFIKLFQINMLLIQILVIFLTIVSLYNKNTDYADHNAQYTVFQGICLIVFLVLFISLIFIAFINDSISNKNLKTSRNGFLPVISGVCMSKYITYLKEDLITQSEIDEINKRERMFEHSRNNSAMDKCIILLPKTDITVKIGTEDIKKTELIKLFDVYKFNGKEIFLLLSDYQIEHDIKLEFKILGNKNLPAIPGDSFELFDLNNEYIGTAEMIKM